MCGIAGIVSTHNGGVSRDISLMSRSLVHRGPDCDGTWSNSEGRVHFAHRRLAINDLSEYGQQPMLSDCGAYSLIYNGELYNFHGIRDELHNLGYSFKGLSDTEVILYACIEWGVNSAVEKFTGMFAFAFYSDRDKTVTIVRDRLGEKPLYFLSGPGCFLFASELRSIKTASFFKASLDYRSIFYYLQYGYTPSAYTVYNGVFKLCPGSILTLDTRTLKYDVRKYWSLEERYRESVGGVGFDKPFEKIVDELDARLTKIIERQIISDVPLGGFLSGGIDSSYICAIANKLCSKPLKTFSVGFDDPRFDESNYARTIAKTIGSDHHEILVDEKKCLEVLLSFSDVYDEPFFDSSSVPMLILSQFARKEVTVALSGDGGDELFWGYNRYRHVERRYSAMRRMKYFLACVNIGALNQMKYVRALPYGNQLARMLVCGGSGDLQEFYQNTRKIFNVGDLKQLFPGTESFEYIEPIKSFSRISDLPFHDLASYLPNDILVKVDRAAMAVSLETRIPMLDHEFVEFAMSIPDKYKMHTSGGKYVLRQALSKHLPLSLFDRPKKGFSIPLASWMRGGLKEYFCSAIDKAKAKNIIDINFEYVEFLSRQHMSGRADNSTRLWALLMLFVYLDKEHVDVIESRHI